MIKDIVENKGANNGFLFKFDSKDPKKGACFRSSEYAQTAQRPKLVITYEPPVTGILPDQFAKSGMTGPGSNVTIYDLRGKRVAMFTVQSSGQPGRIQTRLPAGVHLFDIRTHDGKNLRTIRMDQ